MSGLPDLMRTLRGERDWLGFALVALIALQVFVVAGIAVSPQVARWCMGRFHLRPASFGAWASFQLSPWMYNFENQVLVSERPLRRQELAATGAPFWFINHQSARVFTFADHR